MSLIKKSKPHGMTKEEARKKLEGLVGFFADKYGVKVAMKGDEATVNGKGVSGSARVDDTDVHLELKLGLAARLIAGKIEGGADKALAEHFPS